MFYNTLPLLDSLRVNTHSKFMPRGNQAAAAAAAANQAGFSLTPYNMSNNILDYSTPEGRKHYDRAAEQLNEVKYDC